MIQIDKEFVKLALSPSCNERTTHMPTNYLNLYQVLLISVNKSVALKIIETISRVVYILVALQTNSSAFKNLTIITIHVVYATKKHLTYSDQ
jgi:hypothetical protein